MRSGDLGKLGRQDLQGGTLAVSYCSKLFYGAMLIKRASLWLGATATGESNASFWKPGLLPMQKQAIINVLSENKGRPRVPPAEPDRAQTVQQQSLEPGLTVQTQREQAEINPRSLDGNQTLILAGLLSLLISLRQPPC